MTQRRISHERQRKEFQATLDIVNKWGNKDLPLGEEHERSKGCLADLKVRRLSNDTDEAELMLIDLLSADLSSNPPYRKLSPTTVPEYSRGYATFFAFVRSEGTAHLDAGTWLEAYLTMGGPKDWKESGPVRWQMLHISTFLQSKGFWAPAAFITASGKKKAFLARLPAYTSQAEITAVRTRLDQIFKDRGGTYAAAGIRLQMQRNIPLRISEPRYSRPIDYDKGTHLIHITSTGHDHLKSNFSRGMALLQEPLATEVASISERRNAISVGAETLLFCDSHLPATYAAFDAISDAIRDETQAVTGCFRFRQHDLRAAAVSDVCFEFESELMKVCKGLQTAPVTHDTGSISRKHGRFALATRLARHASSLTTLRYYNCTGLLDLHCHTEMAHASLGFSATYLAAVTGTKAQAFYAASHRARLSKSKPEGEVVSAQTLEKRFSEHLQTICQGFPTPQLANIEENTPDKDTATSTSRTTERLIEACLLNAMGTTVQAASDATLLPIDIVTQKVHRLQQYASQLKINITRQDKVLTLVSALGGKDHFVGTVIHTYARMIRKETSVFKVHALALIASASRCGSRLILKNELVTLELAPFLAALRPIGFRVVFKLGPDRILSQYPGLKDAMESARIEIHRDHSKEDVFGVVSFLFHRERPAQNQPNKHLKSVLLKPLVPVWSASPRSYGRAGRLAITGCLLALSL